MAKEAARVRKRERKNISTGIAHVNSTFNNTLIATGATWNVSISGGSGADTIRGGLQDD